MRSVYGFTLVELLVVVVIIGILSVVGISIFTGTRQKANDARKKADVAAIAKAYEVNYDPSTSTYRTLVGSWFASGQVPTPPDGGTYTDTRGGNGFQICANLAGTTACNSPSATCFCKQSSQEQFIAGGSPPPSSPPSPSPSPSSPPPSLPPSPSPSPSSPPSTSPASGLLAYWKMDDLGTTITNSASAFFTGTAINGAALSTPPNSKIGNARSFTGSSLQYIDVPGGGPLNGLGTGSIAMWVRWSGLQDNGWSGFGHVLARQNNCCFSQHVIGLSGSNPVTATVRWAPYTFNPVITGTIPVGDGTWRFVVVTFQPGDHRLYINNTPDGSSTALGFIDTANVPLTIGGWIDNGGGYSTSIVDEVGVWNRVLTTAEITSLYNGGAGITCP